MLKDRLRTMLFGPQEQSAHAHVSPPGPASRHNPGVQASRAPRTRHSHGLEQFFNSVRDQQNLSLLDLGGTSQENISFITSQGHRIYTEDFLRSLTSTFGEEDLYGNQADGERVEAFLRENLEFPRHHFDGALIWDALQYLSSPLLTIIVDRLFEMLRPQSYLLAFFQAEQASETVPLYSYRIQDAKNLVLSPRGTIKPAQSFNNRAIEKLFERYQWVKFFLTRDHLREVIVKR